MQLDYVQFESLDQVGVITLNRPEAANAQNQKVLVELDQAWQAADRNRDVKVIVLRSVGKHFSAGHDMSTNQDTTIDPEIPFPDALYDWETRHYLHYAKAWREVPKPSIAAVQGKCIAAGLMLCWPCDLIVAADNAEFSDPVVLMGNSGIEYKAHAWEFGARKAKEMLFTGCALTAAEAQQIGMVNKVVALDDLMPATMELAQRIAQQDSFALRMAKRTVNHTLDTQGFTAAIDACFDMHHLCLTRSSVVTGGSQYLADLRSGNEQTRQA